MNKCFLLGRITKDIDTRYTQDGKCVVGFPIAVDREYQKDATDFFNVTAFGKTGEFISKYFEKGRKILISGRLQQDSWTDKEGNKRTAVRLIAEQVYFADSKKEKAASDGFIPVPDGVEDTELPFN